MTTFLWFVDLLQTIDNDTWSMSHTVFLDLLYINIWAVSYDSQKQAEIRWYG
jgi:hypothetical protein